MIAAITTRKVRNERGGTGIILGHALTEEKRDQSNAGEGRTIEGDRGIVPEQDHYAADGAERSGSEFQYRDNAEQQTDHSPRVDSSQSVP
jgi:hypothetical protein